MEDLIDEFNKEKEQAVEEEEEREKSSVLKSFVAGASSGAVTCVLFQPLDLLKTRLQVPSTSLLLTVDTVSKGGHHAAEGILKRNCLTETALNVIRNDSYSGLWRGLTPSLYRTVPGIGMYFCTLHSIKSSFATKPTFYENMALAFTARSIVGTAMLPITVIKTRYESGCFNYKTVPQALKSIWRSEGARGLLSGWTATIARDAPYSGLYYMFYSQQKYVLQAAYQRDLTAWDTFGCGIAAGGLACVATHPADVIKTQMQLHPYRYRSTKHCVVTIVHEKGMGALVRGMVPRCLRKTLISALSWTVFEEIMKWNVKVVK